MEAATEKQCRVMGWRMIGWKWNWETDLDRNPRRLLRVGVLSVEGWMVGRGHLIWRSWESTSGSEDGRCKGPEAGRRLVFWRAREPVGLRKDGERERGGQGWRGTEWMWISNPPSWSCCKFSTELQRVIKPQTCLSKWLKAKWRVFNKYLLVQLTLF